MDSNKGRSPQRPFVPFERFEDVVVRCGHVEKFGLLPAGKDRFRDDRRRKLIGRDCGACRERKRLEIEAADAARRAEKGRRRAAAEVAAKAPRPGGGRLPDGSRFEVAFDAGRGAWSGTLTVPTPGGPLAFEGSMSGLFPLMAHLDSLYRASVVPAEGGA